MGLPRLERACFVLDLKTGNIILGCLNALLSLIMMIVMIVVAVTMGDIKESVDEEPLVETAGMDDTVREEINERAAIVGAYAMSIILVLMFLAKFCFDVLFVYGVISERAGIIKSYFIMWTVFFILSMFTFFINSPHYGAGPICTELFFIGFNMYTILLCYSFYRQLNEREEV